MHRLICVVASAGILCIAKLTAGVPLRESADFSSYIENMGTYKIISYSTHNVLNVMPDPTINDNHVIAESWEMGNKNQIWRAEQMPTGYEYRVYIFSSFQNRNLVLGSSHHNLETDLLVVFGKNQRKTEHWVVQQSEPGSFNCYIWNVYDGKVLELDSDGKRIFVNTQNRTNDNQLWIFANVVAPTTPVEEFELIEDNVDDSSPESGDTQSSEEISTDCVIQDGKIYKISYAGNENLVLDVARERMQDDTPIIAYNWKSSRNENQLWLATKTGNDNNLLFSSIKNTEYVLDSSLNRDNRGRLIVFSKHGHANQLWAVEPTNYGDSSCYIRSLHDEGNKVVEFNINNGIIAVKDKDNSNSFQRWHFFEHHHST